MYHRQRMVTREPKRTDRAPRPRRGPALAGVSERAIDVSRAADRSSGQTTQTVDRALTVLGFFTATEPELSSAEIASRLRLHQTTAYRLLSTMEHAGYVERDARTGLYRLGLKLIELAGLKLNQMDLARHAQPELNALRDGLHLNANLAVLDHSQGNICHLAFAVRPDVSHTYTLLGRMSVAHCTALGKVLLAGRPRSEVHQTVHDLGWRSNTERSLQDFPSLDKALDQIAAQGYAVDDGEHRRNVKCVGAPVRDRTGAVVAAISVSGTPELVDAAGVPHVIAAVTERADAVSARLGHLDSWRR
jgi:DNA-binding IclR family transcriptional regulator